jgi:hypothetical protein
MPSSVEIFSVTKFRPGQLMDTLASVIFKGSPQTVQTTIKLWRL